MNSYHLGTFKQYLSDLWCQSPRLIIPLAPGLLTIWSNLRSFLRPRPLIELFVDSKPMIEDLVSRLVEISCPSRTLEASRTARPSIYETPAAFHLIPHRSKHVRHVILFMRFSRR